MMLMPRNKPREPTGQTVTWLVVPRRLFSSWDSLARRLIVLRVLLQDLLFWAPAPDDVYLFILRVLSSVLPFLLFEDDLGLYVFLFVISGYDAP